jgi:CheY-like chemotaxis protein
MPTTNATVLYVEDDEGDRFFMERAFKADAVISVLRMVPDGLTAIQYLDGSGPYSDRSENPEASFVLLDLNLPELSGFEVLERIRKSQSHTNLPVVIFSSSPDPEDRARANQLGADDFWEKPRRGADFGQIVARIAQRLSQSIRA